MSYGQTYRQKKVIKLAPDMVMHIDRSPTIEICPNCHATLNISDYITDVTTSLSVNGTVGTASFNISFPRHGHNGQYLNRGGRIFGIYLMNEIEIFFKGRFKDNAGNYSYYRSFWGVITNIQETYNGGGQQTFSITCESMLKWLQMMSTNIHPAVVSLESVYKTANNQDAGIATGHVFAQMNVYEIIYNLVTITFKNMIIPSVLDTEKVLEGTKEAVGFTSEAIKEKQLINAWQKKFATIKSSLRMFGTTPESFIGSKEATKVKDENQIIDERISPYKRAITPFEIRYDNTALMDFKPFSKFNDTNDLDLINQTYKNNLEIINEIKLFTGFEFYLDTVGELIFKPPFWNMDTKDNAVYVIEDDDILSWNFSEAEGEVLTRVEVTGNLLPIYPQNSVLNPKGIFTDYNLAKQFGIKSYPITASYFNSARMCYYHAVSEIDRINANRFRGSLTIVGRPELRLGYPVYVQSRDCYLYIENISHSFVFGGPFTTQIEFSAMRRKYVGEDEKKSTILPIKGSRAIGCVGYPSTLLFEKASESLKDIEEQLKSKALKKIKESTEDQAQRIKNFQEDFRKDPTSFLKSNREGQYKEYPLDNVLVLRAYDLLDRAKKVGDTDSYLRILELMIPISDENGYELIGAYEYGRTLYLSQDNVIKKKGNTFREILNSAKNKLRYKNDNNLTGTLEIGADIANIPKELEIPNKNDENELKNAISNFLDKTSAKLARLDPRKSVDVKKCTCTSVNMQSAPLQPKYPKKTIQDLGRRDD